MPNSPNDDALALSGNIYQPVNSAAPFFQAKISNDAARQNYLAEHKKLSERWRLVQRLRGDISFELFGGPSEEQIYKIYGDTPPHFPSRQEDYRKNLVLPTRNGAMGWLAGATTGLLLSVISGGAGAILLLAAAGGLFGALSGFMQYLHWREKSHQTAIIKCRHEMRLLENQIDALNEKEAARLTALLSPHLPAYHAATKEAAALEAQITALAKQKADLLTGKTPAAALAPDAAQAIARPAVIARPPAPAKLKVRQRGPGA